jgi:hypothetical protein
MRIRSRPTDTGGIAEAVNRLARSLTLLAEAVQDLARSVRMSRDR